jgi:hypothetical protein
MKLSKSDGRVVAFVAKEDIEGDMASNVAHQEPIP